MPAEIVVVDDHDHLAGVRGFLPESASPARLLAAVRAVRAGELVQPARAVGHRT